MTTKARNFVLQQKVFTIQLVFPGSLCRKISDTEAFFREIMVMIDLEHKNVLLLMGTSFPNQKPCILFPFMKNKDLKHYLMKNKKANTKHT